MAELSAELAGRVEQDKEALRQWTSLRKFTGENSTKEPSLAARLLQFSRACGIVLELMRQVPIGNWPSELFLEEEKYEVTESSSAGYHTDDSCSPEPNCPYYASLQSEYESKAFTTRQLTDKYAGLYAQAHFQTLDALDALEPLKEAQDLKAKILFSVVVVSYQSN